MKPTHGPTNYQLFMNDQGNQGSGPHKGAPAKLSPNNSRVEDKHGEEERHKGVAGKAAGHRKELNEEEEYNPLKMPPDWKLASNHAKARSTAPDKKKDGANEKVETCPCCGFEIERQQIEYCSDPMALAFLGSGFALFYNFMKFCIIILFIQLAIQQGYNIYTNLNGTYCAIEQTRKLEHKIVHESNCPTTFLLRMSLANKLNDKEKLDLVYILNFISLFVVMGVLLYFRKSQRTIDCKIDEEQTTPADYTVCVKNIPIGLNVDYKKELTNLFQTVAVIKNETEIKVCKVVLVYNIDEICNLEKQMEELVDKKKDAIRDNKYQMSKYSYDFEHEDVKQKDEEIERLEHLIHQVEARYQSQNDKFAGIAFVSFETEGMKAAVIEENKHNQVERIRTWLNRGKTPNLDEEHDLQWHGQKLFIEQAKEPNDVDWEFIHYTTKEKMVARIKAGIIFFLFEFAAFYTIYLISIQLAKKVDEAHEEDLLGKLDPEELTQISIMSSTISFSIVLFNKFVVSKVLHYIVDDEKISNKTLFQIKYATKYSMALFFNAALISYLVDIVILKNIVGYAGFLQNESQIFIINALFPPFVWCVDPWSCCKNIWRRYIKSKGVKALLTQQEANLLMEEPDYLSAKRYSDVMKTMWFTYFYGTAIPLGTLFSAIGLTLYYLMDYYNILRRRTVKESISNELSTEMIEWLEWIIIFSALGNMTMSYAFFKEFSHFDIALLIIALIYINLDMDAYSYLIWPVDSEEELKTYWEGQLDFDTDYDRENPVTRAEAIAEWTKLVKEGGEEEGKQGKEGKEGKEAGKHNKGYKEEK